MLYNNFSEKILGLQGVIIKNVTEKDNTITIKIETARKSCKCPCCGSNNNSVHDYRTQPVKDIPAFSKMATVLFRKRRYRCKECGKRFFEQNNFLAKYQRKTSRLCEYIIHHLRNERSFTSLAREIGVSVSTVMRVFDTVSYPAMKLPTALSIDEFKGNANAEKYHCILTDPVRKVVLDILPRRYEHDLNRYFRSYSQESRDKVSFVVSDMWKPFSNTLSHYFKNATPIIDKYHWIRQIIWAFEAVRKEEQKKLSDTYRRYFKRSKRILTKRYDSLPQEEKTRVNVMLYASVNLSRAHYYKECFLKILDCPDRASAKQSMGEWILNAGNCGIPQFEKAAKTMQNWFTGILNSFEHPITNGFTEGCNNKIKVLKRNAYGYRNFDRFRNRILHMFSHQTLN